MICESKEGIKKEVNVVVEWLETIDVSAMTNESIDRSTSESFGSDALAGVLVLGVMIGIPALISKK